MDRFGGQVNAMAAKGKAGEKEKFIKSDMSITNASTSLWFNPVNEEECEESADSESDLEVAWSDYLKTRFKDQGNKGMETRINRYGG